MAVDYVRPEHAAMESVWKRCRDVISGQDAVHSAGGTYLAKLSGQSIEEYNAYKLRQCHHQQSGHAHHCDYATAA